MDNTPLVSILVPTFNQYKVIEKTLHSILSQSYKNIEILISDDCSSDGTQAILSKAAIDNSNVRLFLQSKNLGITQNYNFLAEKANGEFISIFAGDDIMHPEKIRKQIELLESDRKYSFCHHAVEIIDYATSDTKGIVSHRYHNDITTIHEVLRHLGVPGSMSIVYRREKGRSPAFEANIPTASDWMQIIHLTMSGLGAYIDQPLCMYRKDAEYNGKDPTQYENDFLNTIALTRKQYGLPGDAIDRSCDFALARFLLGSGFRRLARGERGQARANFEAAMNERTLLPAAIALWLFSFIPASSLTLSKIKSIYKSLGRK